MWSCGIGFLIGIKIAVCGKKSVDLTGGQFSCSKKLQNQIIKAIIDIQSALKLWWMRNLNLERRIIIFKTLAF